MIILCYYHKIHPNCSYRVFTQVYMIIFDMHTHSCLNSPRATVVLWIMARCLIETNSPPTHLLPRLLLTQARSALASSVPLPSGCPVAPPTCGTTSVRTTTTTENHLCPPAVCRLACLVCWHSCLFSSTRRVFSSPLRPLFFPLLLLDP